MGRLLNATVSGVLLLGLTVAGCGSADSKSADTPGALQSSATAAHTEHVPSDVILLTSSAFREGSAIPARYTCDGANISPSVRWHNVPKGTAELILFISDFSENEPSGQAQISWSVAGLHPTLKGIATGTIPAGAIVGRNSFGQSSYSVCPKKGGVHNYLVTLYGVRHRTGLKPGYAADALYQTVTHTAEYKGLTGFIYKRK